MERPIFVSKTSAFTLTCGAGSQTPFIAMEDQLRHQLSWTIEGVRDVVPEIPEDIIGTKLLDESKGDPEATAFLRSMFKAQGNVRYTDILPGVTLDMHTDSQLVYSLSFEDRSAVRDISCVLDPHGLEMTQDKETGQIIVGDVNEPVFTIHPASLYDTAGNDGVAKTVL